MNKIALILLLAGTALVTPSLAEDQFRMRLEAPILFGTGGSETPPDGTPNDPVTIVASDSRHRELSTVSIPVSAQNLAAGQSLVVDETDLPTGLSWTPTSAAAGVISGSTAALGSHAVTVSIFDGTTEITSEEFQIDVVGSLTATVPQAAYSLDVGTPLSIQGTASNVIGTVAWSHDLGTLPEGLSFIDGVLSGTPTKAAKFPSAHLTATEQADDFASDSTDPFSLSIRPVITLPENAFGDAELSGEYAPFDFKSIATIAGAELSDLDFSVNENFGTGLPADMTLSADGILSGTPGAVGSFSFEVVASYLDGSGNQSYTILVNGSYLSDVVSISAGKNHACAVVSSGAVYCWGSGSNGVLGTGSTTAQATPAQVVGVSGGFLTSIVEVAAGSTSTCARSSAGGVYCWGSGTNGALGNGVSSNSNTPVIVRNPANNANLSGAASITVGNGHACVLTTGKAVLCWGANSSGQLGTNNQTQSALPIAPRGLNNAASLPAMANVSAGGSFTCATTTTGNVYCWGNDSYAQLGRDGNGGYIAYPVSVVTASATPLTGISKVSSGDYHSCALTTSGSAYCWGNAAAGQLGFGYTTSGFRQVAVQVRGIAGDGNISGLTEIETGGYHSCGLMTGGSMACWGWGTFGQTGNDANAHQWYPAQVLNPAGTAPITGVTSMAGGEFFTCGVTSSGTYCWGQNSNRQLGNGTTTIARVPTGVSPAP